MRHGSLHFPRGRIFLDVIDDDMDEAFECRQLLARYLLSSE